MWNFKLIALLLQNVLSFQYLALTLMHVYVFATNRKLSFNVEKCDYFRYKF